MFTITRFHYLKVLFFSIYFTITGVKNIILDTTAFGLSCPVWEFQGNTLVSSPVWPFTAIFFVVPGKHFLLLLSGRIAVFSLE